METDRSMWKGAQDGRKRRRCSRSKRLKKPEPRAYWDRTSRSCPGCVECEQATDAEASSVRRWADGSHERCHGVEQVLTWELSLFDGEENAPSIFVLLPWVELQDTYENWEAFII